MHQSEAIKTLVKIEIDLNLSLLSQISDQIDKAENELSGNKENQLPDFLTRMSLPIWSHILWESQLPNVPLSLNTETIRRVHEFHSNLDKITGLIQAISENSNQLGYRKELYDQCVTSIRTLRQQGNPIK